MALNQIGEIASGVVEYDFDYITGVSEKSAMLTTTSGCLSGTLGQLNVLINQSFGFASGGSPTPLLQEDLFKGRGHHHPEEYLWGEGENLCCERIPRDGSRGR